MRDEQGRVCQQLAEGREPLSQQMVTAARCLQIDAAAAECISALNAGGIRTILLKGPVTAHWLYSDGTPRLYDDVDLLVAGSRWEDARALLVRLGYRDLFEGMTANELAPEHARRLGGNRRGRRPAEIPSDVYLDLHWSFSGIGAPDRDFWSAMVTRTERLALSGVEVEVPGEPARALLLALHVADHGHNFRRPLRDLERALDQVDDRVWREAHQLAVRLEAVPRFVAGLKIHPEGRELIERLGLEGQVDVASVLRLMDSGVASGLERLRVTAGLAPKARLLARELVPTPGAMRLWAPVARRGRLGLLLAYAYRPAWLLTKLPAGLRAHTLARRIAGSGTAWSGRDT